jgi:VWFA-related protein
VTFKKVFRKPDKYIIIALMARISFLTRSLGYIFITTLLTAASSMPFFAQPRQRIRTVTIPISIFTKKEIKEKQLEELIPVEELTVTEDGEPQQILSIKSVDESPLSIALLIQEDLAGNFNLQIADIKSFITSLPRGTRVMVAYARGGSIQTAQRFTDDLEKAARSLRIVSGSSTFAPRSPYDSVREVLNRFDGVPAGRRAVLLFSDGVDSSSGFTFASVAQSFDLEQAILRAQHRSVAIYSFYSPTESTDNKNSLIAFAGQGALQKLADQTGGRAFASGTFAPISYLPFFREMVMSINRQFSLTYLTGNMKKGYYRVLVTSTNPDIKIEHPRGYYHR